MSPFDIKLRRFVCPGHAGIKENYQSHRLAGKAYNHRDVSEALKCCKLFCTRSYIFNLAPASSTVPIPLSHTNTSACTHTFAYVSLDTLIRTHTHTHTRRHPRTQAYTQPLTHVYTPTPSSPQNNNEKHLPVVILGPAAAENNIDNDPFKPPAIRPSENAFFHFTGRHISCPFFLVSHRQ